MFEVGDRVVCVDDRWDVELALGHSCPLRLRSVYTVSGWSGSFWGQSPDGTVSFGPEMLLREAANPLGGGFCPSRFRKLRDISQSLRELKELAINCPAPAVACERGGW